MYNSPYLGEILKPEWFEPLRYNVTETTNMLDISRKHLSNIINAHTIITPHAAKRLETLTGSST